VSAKPKVFQVTAGVLRADKAGVYQLLIGLSRIVLVLRGACILIREVRVEVYIGGA